MDNGVTGRHGKLAALPVEGTRSGDESVTDRLHPMAAQTALDLSLRVNPATLKIVR